MPFIVLLSLFVTLIVPQAAPTPALDFEFFKTRVQPIFTSERTGHTRCVACHSTGTPMRLQPLDSGKTMWTEEESRRNFDIVRQKVVPGNPGASRLLLHPLAKAAGGTEFHNGGKHFNSKDDPEWQTLAAWVRGETISTSPTGPRKARIIQTHFAGDLAKLTAL